MKHYWLSGLLLVAALFVYSCGSAEIQSLSTTTTTKTAPVVYYFNGFDSQGRLLTCSVDKTNRIYSYNTVLLKESDSGTYSVGTDEVFSLSNGGKGLLLTTEVFAASLPAAAGLPGSWFKSDSIIIGVPTVAGTYGASADGVYNFVSSYGSYGTFEVKSSSRQFRSHDILQNKKTVGKSTEEVGGVIRNITGEAANSVVFLPGEMILANDAKGLIFGAIATTEYDSSIAGTYNWVDSEGAFGTLNICSLLGNKTTFEGISVSDSETTNFTGEARVLANGSFLLEQYDLTSIATRDAVFLSDKIIAFNKRGDSNYIGFGVKFE